jgi:hypothetical protein
VKKFILSASVALIAALVGCAAPAGYHGVTATNGAMYTALNVPSMSNAVTNFQQAGPGFTTMGTVEAEGSAANIIGIISTGDTAYKTLMDKAKAGGAEAITDVYYDAKILNILGLYCKVDLHLYGTGVKYKK